MNSVVLDTDVASLIFKEELSDSMAARLIGYRPCITFVTLGSWPSGSNCARGVSGGVIS